IIDLNEEDEDFINNNDIWKYINVYPEQAKDTQSNDESIITITMAELKEERRRIQSKRMIDLGWKTVTPIC
ncbi:3208_t:CDS:1, partial [Ambispora gerdemannii]